MTIKFVNTVDNDIHDNVVVTVGTQTQHIISKIVTVVVKK